MNLTKISLTLFVIISAVSVQVSYGAIALDRTRVIYNEGEKSVSIGLTNESKDKPYLSQVWLEDDKDQKINSPFIITPPVQRIEATSKSQIKIQAIANITALPKDRESVYYVNVREIPPRSTDINVLQIALQTRIKLFYRPKDIGSNERMEENPLAKKVTLTKSGSNYIVNNPSPYHLTITRVDANDKELTNFEALMISPFTQENLGSNVTNLGVSPSLYYLNDFGGLAKLTFNCQGLQCTVNSK
ncbi:fimbrial biogenesis chaperone [Moellerella wisconsensis]|uniref:Periplasmic fimbrial chaperone n=1 Tax=Moellerella wisconsensis ATCC 35017 TaxID=1354267 RepID=A0A0N0IB51_9GAMM|nr:fimbria/pilus periplasmic chaperone [Moellerella wisconsensis]KPD03593.1 periplasmic fimbrial chaperone [Moellerella wisconsensis ATCC 35017]